MTASTSDYPEWAIPLEVTSGSQANAVAAAVLPAAAGRTTYITGFEVTGSGATVALPVAVTVSGVTGGPIPYEYAAVAGVLLGNNPLIVNYEPPLPATGPGQAITVSCPALGLGNAGNQVNARGYQL